MHRFLNIFKNNVLPQSDPCFLRILKCPVSEMEPLSLRRYVVISNFHNDSTFIEVRKSFVINRNRKK